MSKQHRRAVTKGILELDGVQLGTSRHTGAEAFFLGKTEIAHFHGDDEIDLRLTKRAQKEYAELVRGDSRVTFRESGSDWIAIEFERAADVAYVLKLVRLAVDANRK